MMMFWGLIFLREMGLIELGGYLFGIDWIES